MLLVVDADCLEFPFVQALPKREKSKLALFWDSFHDYMKEADRIGPVTLPGVAATLLGLSHQRIAQLMDDGRLEVVRAPNGARMVGCASLVEFARLERKAGRPTLLDGETTTASLKRVLSSLKNNRK